MEQCQAEQAGKSGAAKVAPFISSSSAKLSSAWALYGILVHMNAFTLRGGIISAALFWFGFVLTTIDGQLRFPRTKADAHGDRQRRLARRHASSSARSSAGWGSSLAKQTRRHSTFTPMERISLPYFS